MINLKPPFAVLLEEALHTKFRMAALHQTNRMLVCHSRERAHSTDAFRVQRQDLDPWWDESVETPVQRQEVPDVPVQHTSTLQEPPTRTPGLFSRRTSPKDFVALFLSYQRHPLCCVTVSFAETRHPSSKGSAEPQERFHTRPEPPGMAGALLGQEVSFS